MSRGRRSARERALLFVAAAQSVAKKTAKDYLGHVLRVRKAGFKPDFLGLAMFIATSTRGFARGTLKQKILGMKFYYDCIGREISSGELNLVKRVVSSHLVKWPNQRPDCANIDFSKLKQLLRLVAARAKVADQAGKVKARELARGVCMQFAFSLRVNQVGKVQFKHLKRTDIGWTYIGPRQKNDVKNEDYDLEAHVCDRRLHDAVTGYVAELEESHTGMFQGFKHRDSDVSRIIKDAAAVFNWDPPGLRMRWSSHSLRYGAIADAMLKDGVEGAKLACDHRSDAMTYKYGKQMSEKFGVNNLGQRVCVGTGILESPTVGLHTGFLARTGTKEEEREKAKKRQKRVAKAAEARATAALAIKKKAREKEDKNAGKKRSNGKAN